MPSNKSTPGIPGVGTDGGLAWRLPGYYKEAILRAFLDFPRTGRVGGTEGRGLVTEWAYVNGEFCELSQARVSVEDRGFQFADGVYEVVMAYGRRPFRLPEHLARLRRSSEAIGLRFDFDSGLLESVVSEGIERCEFADVQIYLQLTRGQAPRSHPFPAGVRPTVVAVFKPRQPIDPARRERGLTLISVPDERWANCHIKSVALLPNVLARQKALEAGADEAVFVSPRGEVHEATSANVFIVSDGALRTPPRSNKILGGITREYVLECAARTRVPAAEEIVRLDELYAADELLMTSTNLEVMGAVRLNDRPIGDGRVGPVTRALHAEFLRGVGTK